MNKNENYIMLDGKKIPLTDEQIKLIQSDVPEKSPFDRAHHGGTYFSVISNFELNENCECSSHLDNKIFNSSNYCTDKNIMRQHALHMQLNNLLWRYSMTHGGGSIDWDDVLETKVYINYNVVADEFRCSAYSISKCFGAVPFVSEKTAEAAIEEIVKQFIAEHPDFDWTKM